MPLERKEQIPALRHKTVHFANNRSSPSCCVQDFRATPRTHSLPRWSKSNHCFFREGFRKHAHNYWTHSLALYMLSLHLSWKWKTLETLPDGRGKYGKIVFQRGLFSTSPLLPRSVLLFIFCFRVQASSWQGARICLSLLPLAPGSLNAQPLIPLIPGPSCRGVQ